MPASRSAVEMPRNIAALLPKARRKPVALSQNGKTTAVLMGVRQYQKMAAAAKFLQNNDPMTPEEERKLAAIADAAIARDDFADDKESRALLDDILAQK